MTTTCSLCRGVDKSFTIHPVITHCPRTELCVLAPDFSSYHLQDNSVGTFCLLGKGKNDFS
jgi:hypothetical protein